MALVKCSEYTKNASSGGPMKILLVLLLAGFTSGCATFYQPSVRAGVECEDEQCARIWQRAQTWLATHSSYRIQVVNDNIIQTYGPHDNVYDAVAYTVTKEPRSNGKTLISVYGACYANMYGCVFDPAPPTNRLYYELKSVK